MNDAINRKDEIGAILSIGHIAELRDGDAVIRVSAVNYVLRNLPSAAVQPVRHGHWIEHICELFPAEGTVECSECHEHESIFLVNDKYCPNCGAKMDGEQNE